MVPVRTKATGRSYGPQGRPSLPVSGHQPGGQAAGRSGGAWARATRNLGPWLSGIIAHCANTGPAFQEGPLVMTHHEMTYGPDGQVSGAIISVWVPREAVTTFLNRISAP